MSLSADQIALIRQKIADPGTSAVQSILIDNAIDGTFTVSFDGQTTTAIDYGAGANAMQNALAALTNIGTGNISVVNTAPYVVYFTGTLGNVAQPMLTVDDSNLIGMNISVTVSQVTAGGTTAFTDDELNANYTLAKDIFFLCIAYCIDDLLANAAKFNLYVAGQTREAKGEIFDHLLKMSEFYHQWANADQQVQIAGLAPVPPRTRAWPYPSPISGANLNMTPGGKTRWRRTGWGDW